ncbi:class I adenylate-forming enzyme family protein [Nocardia sp. NPDC057227]|uniref:class I adenylate-forming enzyme family protein n=1 Tax=Nocardia sp. NPDC057227 TaxID=3346056 RepID=UPI003636CC46
MGEVGAVAPGVLGGAPDDPAVRVGGQRWSYRDLERAIGEWNARYREVDCYDASELGSAEALIAVCAAARRGIPVRVENPDARPERAEIPPGAFLLVATSGSTGRPRPLARTAASWYDSFPDFSALTGITAADRVLLTGPPHATMHLFGALHALWAGACVTDEPGDATVVHAVPAVLREVVRAAPELRTAVLAGIAPDPGALAVAGHLAVVEYYGSAEISLVAARRIDVAAAETSPIIEGPAGGPPTIGPAAGPSPTIERLAGASPTVGRPAGASPDAWGRRDDAGGGPAGPTGPLRLFPGVEAEIRDGLLFVRTPYAVLGAPEWSGVGDLAELGADGQLRVRGRGDCAINVGGTLVVAEDVEQALAAVPGVRAVAVVGAPHSVFGSIVTAAVELHPDTELAAVRARARLVLSREAVPRRWVPMPRLPRTAAGKVARGALRDLLV